jgi:hypothetical protein
VPDRKLRPRDDVIAEGSSDVCLLVDVVTQDIYELNDTAWRIWQLISEGSSEEQIVLTLQEEFEASEADIRESVAETVDDLLELGLIRECCTAG